MKYNQEKYWRYNTMTIGETVRKALKEISEGLLDLISPKDFKLTEESDDVDKPTKEVVGVNPFVIAEITKIPKNSMTPVKPKRARTAKGRYKGDDKLTDDINEAWVGGKAPKKKAKRKTKGKK